MVSPHSFWRQLATALINNMWDETDVRRRASKSLSSSESPDISVSLGRPRSGNDVHLTPTKRLRRKNTGRLRGARLQNKCKFCLKKTKWICSKCLGNGGEIFLCHS